jgi:hypothetical protein
MIRGFSAAIALILYNLLFTIFTYNLDIVNNIKIESIFRIII